MGVEGITNPSIARIKGLSWNTVARWIERAALASRRFNDLMTRGYMLRVLQAEEITTFTLGKNRSTWILSTIEVWSRLWPPTVLGPRNYRSTWRLMADTAQRGRFTHPPFITTDGFRYYRSAVGGLFGLACAYAQVMKTWRRNGVIRVERKLLIGSLPQLSRRPCPSLRTPQGSTQPSSNL